MSITFSKGIAGLWRRDAAREIVIDDKEVVVTGGFLKTARLKEEWDGDVEQPEDYVSELRGKAVKVDLFTFQQRLPDCRPRFEYYLEWDNVAALPISSYEHWLTRQVHVNARNKIKKGLKQGVVVKIVEYNDELVRGIMDINNESPFRQGHRYSHYGKDFETTRRIYSTYFNRACFVGAYVKEELIGFIKLVRTERYMRTMGIVAKIKHRDKGPTNLLIGKAVEICAQQGMPYLVYGKFTYGKRGSDTLKDFKRFQGFESIVLPRYFVPVSRKGALFLRANLQHGFVDTLPRKWVRFLRGIRVWFYSMRAGEGVTA